MKIAVIGGGSTYTPELIDGFITYNAELKIDEVVLADPDHQRLEIVGNFCQRMVEHAGLGFTTSCTSNTDQALEGADFVITQIRVGGQEGRHKDIQLGLKYDLVGQETTGVGGFAKALRSVPVILELSKQMDHFCPQAWLINFTNPSGLVTEAILKHGRQKAIGLCNNPISLKMDIAEFLKVDPQQVELDYIGLNHLSWVRAVLVEGKDVLPQALQSLASSGRPANIPEELDYSAEFLQTLGMIPSSYLRYYYLTRQAVQNLKAKPISRAQEVIQVENDLMDIYRDIKQVKKPKELEKRGGAYYSRAAVELIRAIDLDLNERHVVITKNQQTISCLPDDCSVEVPCRINRSGAQPLELAPPEVEIRGLIQQVKAYEELAVEAAYQKNKRLAILALLNHPLVADSELACQLVDDITKVHGIAFS
jgi:6-phospho-beta-glucosidase